MKKLLLLALCFLVACQTGAPPSPLKRLTLNLQEGDPPSFNPYVGVDLRSRCLFLALYEPLYRKAPDGSLTPAAATHVDIDPTQTVYTFHIRPHVWSDGVPVTSHHFADAWRYALTPGTPCIRADLFYPIKNAERAKRGEIPLSEVHIYTPDAQTLVVELAHPLPYFLDLTATTFFAPLRTLSNENPTAFNGPFVLGEHHLDQSLTFDKNGTYWDADAVQLDQIHFTLVRDPMTALSLYQSGELDVIGDPFSGLPIEILPTLSDLHSQVISRIFYLLLSDTQFPFNNKTLRQALNAAIDRTAITTHLFPGELPSTTLIPKPLSLITTPPEPQDARALFAKALDELNLTPDTFPKLTLSYAELSGQKRFAEFLQQELKQILGIELEVVSSQWNAHVANIRKRNYQISTFHFTTLYPDPMFYLDFFRDGTSLANYTGWEDPAFRALVEESNTLDPAARKRQLEQAELLLRDAMPAIPLFTQNLQYLIRENVYLPISDLGIYDFKSARIE